MKIVSAIELPTCTCKLTSDSFLVVGYVNLHTLLARAKLDKYTSPRNTAASRKYHVKNNK